MFAYLFMSGSKFAEKKSSLKRENNHFYWMNNPFWLNVLNIFMKTIECQQPFAYWKHLFACSCQWYEERNWKAIPFINFKVEIEIWFAYILRNQHYHSTIPLVELQNDNVYSFGRCPCKLLPFSPWYTLFPDDNKLLSPTTSWNSSTRLHLLC